MRPVQGIVIVVVSEDGEEVAMVIEEGVLSAERERERAFAGW